MMENIVFVSDRQFKFWSYTISMSQLLLRSPKVEDKGTETRVDIMFQGVSFICLPNILKGVKIVELDRQSVHPFVLPRQLYESNKIFRLTSEDYQAYIVASLCVWHEDTSEFWEQSFWQKRDAEFRSFPRS
jgi:predicted rRNA methylase YqxC with S4 and FtsJ domains